MLKYWEWFLHLFFHYWSQWEDYGEIAGWPAQQRTCLICGRKQVKDC